MACRDEGRFLNEFMELTIQIDNLMHSRRPVLPAFTSTPLTSNSPEPMQLGYTHLTPEERERRILCMYCGQSGHHKSSCPVRPTSSNTKAVSGQTRPKQFISCVKIPVKLFSKSIAVVGLLDSGAAGNFISREFADKHNLALTPCTFRLAVQALDGRPLGEAQITDHLRMQTGMLPHETLQFYVINSPIHPLILGLP